jgi:plasmid replication initiation protein
VYDGGMPKKTVESSIVNVTAPELDKQLKKHVGAIHTSGDLSFLERKLSNILLVSAYDDLLTKRTHSIPVNILCPLLGWDDSKNYTRLKDALKKLASTPIEFNLHNDGVDDWQTMSILSFAQIKGGICSFRYDEALAEKFYDPEIYAMINLQIQRKLDGAYALTLYENCVRYRPNNKKKHGSTGEWSLALFRSIIGATSKHYDDFRRLNSKIIKPAIAQINKVTDIFLTAFPVKQGTQVVGIRFEVSDNPNTANQTSLDGLSLAESVEANAEIKALAVYKNLIKHGVSERAAIMMINTEGAERMQEIVSYTENRAKKIKNTGAYIKRLVDEKAQVGLTEFQKQELEAKEKAAQAAITKKEAERSHEEQEADLQKQKRQAISEAFDALADDRKDELRAMYSDTLTDMTRSYFVKEGEKGSMHKIKFLNFIEPLLKTE